MSSPMPRLSLRADAGVGSICVSPSGRDAVLAGHSGLCVVDLEDPFLPPRWLPLRNAWEVAKVQWCPDPGRPAWVVSSNNQKALVWNLALPSNRAIEHVLHGHRRAVTDIDFSPHRPELLATASIDATVKVWDLRSPEGPTMTFAEFDAGALQAKWSVTNSHQIASAHENRIILWDSRKANLPVTHIKPAHTAECNGIQFLPSGRLLSCSTDRTLKVWDLEDNENHLKLRVNAGFPVWRALITPYELGCHVVPLRGGQNKVYLINLAIKNADTVNLEDVVLDELPHPEPVKDILYRRSELSRANYDVVTWCHDSHLRDWENDKMMSLPHASSASGCKDDEPPPIPDRSHTYNSTQYDLNQVSTTEFLELPIFRRNEESQRQAGQLDWIAGVQISGTTATDPEQKQDDSQLSGKGEKQPSDRNRDASALSHEIISVSTKFPKVEFENVNIPNGSCVFTLHGPWGPNKDLVNLRAQAAFPVGYPGKAMSCEVERDAQIDGVIVAELKMVLSYATMELARHNVPALEYCVRYLVGDSVSLEDALTVQQPMPDFLDPAHYEPASDKHFSSTASESGTDDQEELIGIDQLEHFEQLDDLDDLDPNIQLESRDSLEQLEQFDQLGLATGDTGTGTGASSTSLYNVPLPKNSGAIWSNTGKLVCFFNNKPATKERGPMPLPLGKVFAEEDNKESEDDPFASDIDEFSMGAAPLAGAANWSVAAAQLTANLGSQTRNARSQTINSGTSVDGSRLNSAPQISHEVVLVDCKNLWPCRPDVAKEYRCDIVASPLDMATHNAGVAAKYGLRDEEYFWKLMCAWISVDYQGMMSPFTILTREESKFDWGGGTLGLRSTLAHMAKMLESQGNIQMLACMSCVLSSLRSHRTRSRQHINSGFHSNVYEKDGSIIAIEAGSEILLQVHSSGDVVPVAQRVYLEDEDDQAIASSREQSPMWENSVATVTSDNWWPDPELSITQTTPLQEIRRSSSASPGEIQIPGVVRPQGRTGSSHLNPNNSNNNANLLYAGSGRSGPSATWHDSLSGRAPSSGSKSSNYGAGPLISLEITNSSVFEFYNPPNAPDKFGHATNFSDTPFANWMPRLVRYRVQYAKLLHEWGHYIQQAEVSKLNFDDPLVDSFSISIANEIAQQKWFDIQTNGSLTCAFCETPIHRLFSHCDLCCHAMHRRCAEKWWAQEKECPMACGCKCKF